MTLGLFSSIYGLLKKMYLLNKLVYLTLESHLLDLADCILTALFQFCLFNSDLIDLIDSDLIFLREYFTCVHPLAVSLLVLLGAIDG